MSKVLYTCRECKGKGSYTIHNAYDKEWSEEITCEYCGGTGFVERNVEVPVIKIDVVGKTGDLN